MIPGADPPLPPAPSAPDAHSVRHPHPGMPHLHALTSLRFVAAAYVLAFHYDRFYFPDSAPIDAVALGYSGVTFFFVLSGFILAYNYHRVDFGAANRARFFRARFARVCPVYLLSLLVALPWLVAWVMKSPSPLRELRGASAVLAPLGLHAWVPGAACALDCPSWSISAELFFYLLLPALLPAVLRRPGRAAGAAVAGWAAFGLLATLAWQRYGEGASLIVPEAGGTVAVLLAQAIKYNPLLRLPEFVFGLVLFVVWQRHRPPVAVLVMAAAAAAAVLVASLHHVPEPFLHNGLTALAWAPAILAGALIRSGPLVAPWFVFLGRISFALYLLHTPVYALLNTLDRAALGGAMAARPWLAACVATALTLAASAAVHLWVEEPARRRILDRAARPRLMPAVP